MAHNTGGAGHANRKKHRKQRCELYKAQSIDKLHRETRMQRFTAMVQDSHTRKGCSLVTPFVEGKTIRDGVCTHVPSGGM